jgi:heme/copper-type cytochrome/quinol oxidase subunit 2
MNERSEKNDLGETIAGRILGIVFVLLTAYFLFQLAVKMVFSWLLSGSGSDLEGAMTLMNWGVPVFLAVVAAFGAAAGLLFWRQMKKNRKKPDSAESLQSPFIRGVMLGLPTLIVVILCFVALIIWTLSAML